MTLIKPSLETPKYSVAILSSGKRYLVNGICTNLSLAEPKNTIAQKVSFNLINMLYEGEYLCNTFKIRDRVYVYANTGSGDVEVFRGFIWDNDYESAKQKKISIVAYDNLMYFQESDDSFFFPDGRTTQSAIEEICSNWGVNLKYNFVSITHPKLPCRGKLADIITTELLEKVRKQTGKKYVVRCIQDEVNIDHVGANKIIYEIVSKQNAISTKTTSTMSGMITKVKIMGKQDDDGRTPVEAALTRNTDQYGTLQRLVSNSDSSKLSEAQDEANELLDEKSTPEKTVTVEAIDIPWVRKGDKVKLAAGNLVGHYIVTGTNRNAATKVMTLDLEAA